MKFKHIAFEGNIGAGKTSLAKILAEETNAQLILEEFQSNIWLPQFYKDPSRFALPLELSFLMERHRQLRSSINTTNDLIVSDYFFEKCAIFAKVNLTSNEYQLFKEIAHSLAKETKTPDLIIFLAGQENWLLRNISKRGRSFEYEINIKYLRKLNQSYLTHLNQIKSTKVVIVNAQDFDLETVNKPNVVEQILCLLGQDFKLGINYYNSP